jgi:hypothetical protein
LIFIPFIYFLLQLKKIYQNKFLTKNNNFIFQLLSKAMYRRPTALNGLPGLEHQGPDNDRRETGTVEQFEEILITDEEDPNRKKKKSVRVPANRRNSAMNIISRLQANGEEIDINLIRSILNLNLNDDSGSDLKRVSLL